MREKIKILFVYLQPSSFVKADLEILQRHFAVTTHQWTRTRDIKNLLRVIWHIIRTDVSFIWFADIHATRVVFLSKLFNKRSIVVASGYSVANMPEINYGLMSSQKSCRRVKYVLKNADKLLAVSEFNKCEIVNYADPRNVALIYHGVNHNKFKPHGEKEDDLVITAGAITKSNLKRKGLETFARAAKFLPHITFVLIGGHSNSSVEELKSIASPNVEFPGFISDEELLRYYQRAKAYVQVSAHEGFGCSLAEAMLCECVPVVTDRGAIPEVVGDAGFYAAYNNPKDTALKIKEALDSNLGRTARERIERLYPIEKREKELITAISSLV